MYMFIDEVILNTSKWQKHQSEEFADNRIKCYKRQKKGCLFPHFPLKENVQTNLYKNS